MIGDHSDSRLITEVILDGGELAIPPSPETHDLYIGRLVTRTSGTVQRLKQLVEPSGVIEAYGQFVVPITYRRRLAKFTGDSLTLMQAVLGAIDEQPKKPIQLERVKIARQRSGSEYSVSIPYDLPIMEVIGYESRKTDQVLTSRLRDSTHPTQPILRIYETPHHQDAVRVATFIDSLDRTQAQLSVPIICGVPKR